MVLLGGIGLVLMNMWVEWFLVLLFGVSEMCNVFIVSLVWLSLILLRL